MKISDVVVIEISSDSKKNEIYILLLKNSSAKLSSMFCALRNLIFFHRASHLLENIDARQPFFKRKVSSNHSACNLIIDSKKNREKFPRKTFEQRNKVTWIEI